MAKSTAVKKSPAKKPAPSSGPTRSTGTRYRATAQEERICCTVTVDGEPFVLYLDEITNAIEIAVHRSTGMTVEEILSSDEWPRYQLAAIVFMVRRIRGERVAYVDVADSMSWVGNTYQLGDPTLEDGAVAPKAPGA